VRKIEIEDYVAAAAEYRKENPTPLTLQALISELDRQLLSKPQRKPFKDAICSMIPDAGTWIVDLEGVAPVLETKDLLEQWVAKPSGRDAIQGPLRDALDRDSSNGALLQVARAIGAAEGTIDWNAVQIGEVSNELRQEVINAAIDAGEFAWAVENWCRAPSPPPKTSRDRLAKVEVSLLLPVIASRIEAWPVQAHLDAAIAEAVVRLITLANGLKTPDLTGPALRGLAAAKLKRPAKKWATSLANLAVSAPEELPRAFESLELDVIATLLEAATSLPGSSGTARIAIIKALVGTSHRKLLSDPTVWRDIDIDVIGDLLNDAELGPPLIETAGESVFKGLVGTEASKSPPWRVLMLAGKWPRFGPYVEVAHLDRSIQGSNLRADASAALVRELLARATKRATADVASMSEQVSAAEASAKERVTELEAMQAELVSTRAELRRGIDIEASLRQLLAEQSGRTTSALDAEINQGRVDALRAIANFAEDVRALVGLKGSSQDAIATLLRDLQFTLTGLGVTTEGQPGEIRPARPEIDEGAPLGSVVEVITPAYLLPTLVTPLRRSFVRVIEGG